jgi:ATP-dependent Clp protease ATP-binding subunit ClpC
MTDHLERWNAPARKVAELALREALGLGHNYIGTEHLLLALSRMEEGVSADVLKQHGLDRKSAHRAVVSRLALQKFQQEKNQAEVDRLRQALHDIAGNQSGTRFYLQGLAADALKDQS